MSKRPISLRFSESMTGFVKFDANVGYESGFRQGRKDDTRCAVALVLEIADLHAFLGDPQAQANATGYVDCPKLGGRCHLERGTVNLLVDLIPRRHRFKDFRYRLVFRTPAGRRLTLAGVKFVDDHGIIHLWRDTTKLFTRIFEGDIARDQEDHAPVVAAGILRLHLVAFLKMLMLARSVPATPAAWIKGMSQFLWYFGGSLWQVYGLGKRP